MKKILFTILLLAFSLGALTAQTNFYVSETLGDDTQDGTSWSTAFASIDKALDSMEGLTGDITIHVSQGTYMFLDNAGNGGTDTDSYQLFSGQNISIIGGYPTPTVTNPNPTTPNPLVYTTAFNTVGGVANDADSVFEIASNVSLSLEGITIINAKLGNDSNGALVSFNNAENSSLTLKQFKINEWRGGDGGTGKGLIYVDSSDNIIIDIDDSVFERSVNRYSPGQVIVVGPTSSRSSKNVDITVDNSVFRNIFGIGNNAALFVLKFNCDQDQGQSTLAINNSEFTNIRKGRAVNQGPSIIETEALASLTLNGNTFQGNIGGEGGLVQYTNSGSINSFGNTYRNNLGGQSGGAFFISGDYECTIASDDVRFENDKFIGNKSGIGELSGYGGAIHIANALTGTGPVNKKVTITNCDFLGNSTYAQHGGAIYAHTTNDFKVINSRFCDNRANRNQLQAGSSPGGYGGAINIRGNGPLTVSGSTFKNNVSYVDGGAINTIGRTSVTIDDCTYFEGNQSRRDGGAVYTNTDTNLENVYFKSNSAGDEGGAIFADQDLNITGADFESNSADGRGGAIHIETDAQLVFNTVNFVNNTTQDDGGAIDIFSSAPLTSTATLTINHGYFEGNKAINANGTGRHGGAMHVIGYGITTDDVIFKDNRALGRGGAIYFDKPGPQEINLINGEYYNNEAGSGGALHFNVNSGTHKVNNNDFSGNNATERGGAIAIMSRGSSEIDEMKYNSFKGNTLNGLADNTNRQERSDIYLDGSSSSFTARIVDFDYNNLQFEPTIANYPSDNENSESDGYNLTLGGNNNNYEADDLTISGSRFAMTDTCSPFVDCPNVDPTPVSPIVVSASGDEINTGNGDIYTTYTLVDPIPNTVCEPSKTEVAFTARSNASPNGDEAPVQNPIPELNITYTRTTINKLTGSVSTQTGLTINANTPGVRVEESSDEIPLNVENGNRDLYKTYYLDVTEDIQPGYTYTYTITDIEVDNPVGANYNFNYSNNPTKTEIIMDFCACIVGYNPDTTLMKDTQVGISTLDRGEGSWLTENNALGAYIVLESKTKGFVVPRYENTADVNALGNEDTTGIEDGMIVWDAEANCLKMFYDHDNDDSTPKVWDCISNDSCDFTQQP